MMQVNTTELVKALKNMAEEFSVLAEHYDEVSTECLAYDMMFSLKENLKKHLTFTKHEHDFLVDELNLYICQCIYLKEHDNKKTESPPKNLKH